MFVRAVPGLKRLEYTRSLNSCQNWKKHASGKGAQVDPAKSV